ncbi:DnaJ family molecular chaperone [Agrobacterium tumefaciens]|nr:DnaJ family molecular chaperone [Agrobacterium tumefaciens]
MRDPYSILGVKRDARHEEIKAAWRTKAKTVHPDANRDDPDASARFAEIGQAYDLLKDPKKRDLYDQARRAAEKKQRGETIMQQREAAREAAERAKAAEKLMEELARADAATGRRPARKPTARRKPPKTSSSGFLAPRRRTIPRCSRLRKRQRLPRAPQKAICLRPARPRPALAMTGPRPPHLPSISSMLSCAGSAPRSRPRKGA